MVTKYYSSEKKYIINENQSFVVLMYYVFVFWLVCKQYTKYIIYKVEESSYEMVTIQENIDCVLEKKFLNLAMIESITEWLDI